MPSSTGGASIASAPGPHAAADNTTSTTRTDHVPTIFGATKVQPRLLTGHSVSCTATRACPHPVTHLVSCPSCNFTPRHWSLQGMHVATPSLRVLALLLSAVLGSGLPTATPALRHPCTGLFLPFSGCNVRATVTIPDGSSASSALAAGDGVTACAFVRVGAGVASVAVLTLSSATSGFQGSLVLQPSPGDR